MRSEAPGAYPKNHSLQSISPEIGPDADGVGCESIELSGDCNNSVELDAVTIETRSTSPVINTSELVRVRTVMAYARDGLVSRNESSDMNSATAPNDATRKMNNTVGPFRTSRVTGSIDVSRIERLKGRSTEIPTAEKLNVANGTRTFTLASRWFKRRVIADIAALASPIDTHKTGIAPDTAR